MSMQVNIAPFEEQHLQPLRELFASYFPAEDRLLSAAYTRWLYAENPYGAARMVYVESESAWVGFMAMVPVDLVRQAERARAYYVVNVLVHPRHQGHNLFGRMITAAREAVTAEGSALLGHPNDLALKAWQRARMHFQDPLRPSLALPAGFKRPLQFCVIATAEELPGPAEVAATVAGSSPGWRVRPTMQYLDWRYLRHPTNHYHLQSLQHRGEIVGLQVTRQVRGPLALLIDQFVPPALERSATRCLPFPTFCFRPRPRTQASWKVTAPLPWKKQLPFFFTYPAVPTSASSLEDFGLSASDF